MVLAELPANYALRGDPPRAGPEGLADIEGFVEAPPEWLPALRAVNDSVSALAGLHPSIGWIHRTWGGPRGGWRQ